MGIEPVAAERTVSPVHDDQRAFAPFGIQTRTFASWTTTGVSAPASTKGRLRLSLWNSIDPAMREPGPRRGFAPRTATKQGVLGGAVGERIMGRSGSEIRRRRHIHKARFTDEEDALIREQAMLRRLSISSLIRHALLNEKPPRASRQPTLNDKIAAQLLGMLAQHTTALKDAAAKGTPGACDDAVKASCRDAAEMRALWFEVFGREP